MWRGFYNKNNLDNIKKHGEKRLLYESMPPLFRRNNQ
jgi:hypothetical protein